MCKVSGRPAARFVIMSVGLQHAVDSRVEAFDHFECFDCYSAVASFLYGLEAADLVSFKMVYMADSGDLASEPTLHRF